MDPLMTAEATTSGCPCLRRRRAGLPRSPERAREGSRPRTSSRAPPIGSAPTRSRCSARAGRPRARRHLTEPPVALDQRPEVVQRALVQHGLAADVDADELAVEQVAVADLLQPRATEEVRLLVPLDEPLEPAHVQRRVIAADV